MEQITKEPVSFGTCGIGHLFKSCYQSGNIVIFAGKAGQIGKLSVCLFGCINIPEKLKENEFFVKLHGTGDVMNGPCMETGLFEVASKSFKVHFGIYQKWRLKINS